MELVAEVSTSTTISVYLYGLIAFEGMHFVCAELPTYLGT